MKASVPILTLENVSKRYGNLTAVDGLTLDPRFGVVPLDPKQGLYAVRSEAVDDLARRQALSPEIEGAYGDVRISTA